MGDETGRFQRSDRLLASRDFRRVLRRGWRHAHQDIVVIALPISKKSNHFDILRSSKCSGSRLGITASRKVGGAVVRNRFKRRIRAWFRMRRAAFETDLDLVVIARRSGVALSQDQLDNRLSKLLGLAFFSGRAPSDTAIIPGG
jgi:ribonuclease P protein component